MGCLSYKSCFFLFISIFFLFHGWRYSYSQVVTNPGVLCTADNSSYTYNFGNYRDGFWRVTSGSGTFSDSTTHVNATISNIGFGNNVYKFYEYDGSPLGYYHEHTINITNHKPFAGNDTTICYNVANLQLTGSNPAVFGASGTWTVQAGTGAFANATQYSTTVSGYTIGSINRYRWTINGMGGGCGTAYDEINVTVPAIPNAFAGADKTICEGASTTITASAGVGYSYLWSTSATTQSITVSPVASSNYSLTVTDGNNCKATDDININLNILSAFLLSSATTTYCSSGTGVTLSLAGSEVGVNYQLLKGGANDGAALAGTGGVLTWANKTAGTYTVVGTNPTTTCSKAMNGSVTLTANPSPTIFNVAVGPFTYCSHTTGVTVTLGGSENGANFQYQLYKNGVIEGAPIPGTGGNLTWNNNTAGGYTVRATNTLTGCAQVMTGTAVVSVTPSPQLFNISGSGTYCQGSSGLPVVLDNSEVGSMYLLYKDGGSVGAPISGTGLSMTWANQTSGVFTVQALKSAGPACIRTMNGSVTLTEIPLPTVYTLSGPTFYCSGINGVTLTLNGSQIGTNYNLKKGGVIISTLAGTGGPLLWANILAGTYTVDALTTGALSCSKLMSGSIVVTTNPPIVANAGADVFLCRGESKQLLASGGNTYAWSPTTDLDNPNISSPNANPINTTTYTVTVTDNKGCSATDQIQVTVRDLPTVVTSSNTTICYGQSSILTATDNIVGNNESYTWNTGSANDTVVVFPSTNTTYYVTLTDENGCKNSSSVSVNVNASPGVNAGSDTKICNGASATLTGNGNADTWQWSTGATTQSVVVSPPVTSNYVLKGTFTATGCITYDTVKVTVNNLPVTSFTLNGSTNTQLCNNGAPVTLAGTPPGGGFTSSVPGAISGNNFNPVTAGVGSHTITYNYTDANSCTGTNTVTVDIYPPPVVSITGLNASYCNNTPVFSITGNPLQDGNGNFGVWSFSGPAAALINNGDGTALFNPSAVAASGTYTVTYSVANTLGCLNTSSKIVTINFAPNISFVGLPNSICQNASPVTLTGNMAPSGTFSGLGITDNTNGTASYNPGGYIPNNYSISYTYQDPVTLCSSTYAKVTAVKLSPSSFTITGGGTYCQGAAGLAIGLSSSTSAIAYELFLNGYTTSQTIVGNGAALNFGIKTAAGTYTVVATDPANTCTQNMTGSSAISIDPLPADAQAITGTASVCPGSTYSYSIPAVANATSYVWTLPANASIASGFGTNSITVLFASNAVAGNITALGRNACGNGRSSLISVIVRPTPSAAGIITGNFTVCQGELNVVYSVPAIGNATGYVWSTPFGGTIISGQGTNSITVNYSSSASSGNVSVYGTNSCGDGTSSSRAIVVTPTPQLTVNPPSGLVDCSGSLVTVSASSTTGGAAFAWTAINGGSISGATNTASVTVSKTGDYIVAVTASSCVSRDTVTVASNLQAPQNVNITSTNSGNVTCTTPQVTLTATTTSAFPASYLWTPSLGGNIVSGGTTAFPVVDKGGVYEVKVTNIATSCFTIKNITISELKSIPAISVTNPETEILTCANPNATLYGNSTTSGITYNWSGPGIVSDGTTGTPIVNVAGIYTLTVTAPNGCTSIATVQVLSDNTLPAITIMNNPAILGCTNSTLTLSGSSTTAGATLLWTGPGIVSGATTQTPVINLPGNYTLTVTHPINGCTISQTTTVTQDLSVPVINFSLVPVAISCSQTSTSLNGTVTPANSVLLWTGPGTISNNAITNPTVNASGNYSLSATHTISGCSTSRILTVPDGRTPADVSIAVPSVISCSTPSITLHGSTTLTNYTALWTTVNGTIIGSTANLDAVVSKAGIYTLTITNNISGCTLSQNVTVASNVTPPDIIVDKNPVLITCTALQVTLYGASATAGATLLWTGPAGATITDSSTTSPKVNLTGTYTLTVTAPNGCTSSDIITVNQDKTIPAVPSIITPQKLTCSRTTVQLEVSPLIANTDYLWTTSGTGVITNPNSPIATVDNIGTYTAKVTNRTSGCFNQNSVIVSMDNNASVAAITGGPYTLSCATLSLILDGSTSTGINPVWTATLGGNIVSGGNTFNPTINAVGTYTITTSDATTGCISSASISVTSAGGLPALTIDPFPKKLTCLNLTDTLSGQTEPGTTYTWTASPGNIIADLTTLKPVVNQAGTYILTVTKTATGCVNTAAIVVVQDKAIPSLAISTPSKITCSTNQIQLKTSTTATSVSYSWTTSGTGTIKPGNSTLANPFVLSIGTYNLTITDLNNGCINSGNVAVTDDNIAPNISLNKTPAQLTCTVADVTLSGSSTTFGVNYNWTTAGIGNIINPTSNNPRIDAPGIYRLTITNPANGCTSRDSVNVSRDTIVPQISVVTNPATLNCTVKSVAISGNSSTPNVTYKWSGSGAVSDPTIKQPTVTVPGIYNLTVTSLANGCTSSLPVTVTQNINQPAAPIAGNGYSCFNSPAATLSATGSNIKWYSDASLSPALKIHDGNAFTPSSLKTVGDSTYFVTQTDALNNCESPSTSVTYSVRALPLAPVNTDKSICQGTANPALQALGTDTIKWFNTLGGSLLMKGGLYTPPGSISAPGIYTYYATQTNAFGCQSVAVPVKLTINAVPAKPVLNKLLASICVGFANPSFTASGTNVKWYDNLTMATPVATGGTYTTIQTTAGVYPYYVTQTNAAGCTSAYETVTLTISALPQKFTVTGGGTYCADQNGIIIGLNGSELNTTYQLLLNGVSVVGTTMGNGSAFDYGYQKTDGTYSVMATGSTGCQNAMNGSAAILSTALPDAAGAITGPIKVCQGVANQVYTIPPIAHATSYIWTVPPGATINSGQGTNTINVSYSASATSGIVTVKGMNACNSGAISTLNINVVPSPQLSINATPAVLTCNNPSVTLTASSTTPGTTFSWTPINGGHILSGANTASPGVDAAGDYTVTVLEPVNFCTTKSTVAVIADLQKPQIVTITPSDLGIVTCKNPTISLAAIVNSVSPVSYSWTASSGGHIVSGANTANLVIDKAGVYDVLVTNINNGCSSTQSITISEQKNIPDIAVVDPASQKLSCSVASIVLSSSSVTPGVSFNWTGPNILLNAGSPTPTVGSTGIYTLTVTAPNGCTASKTVQVLSDFSVPTISVNSNPAPLTCSTTSINLAGSSTTTGATLQWNGPGIISGANTQTPIVNQPGIYTLTVYHPLSNCTATSQVTVIQDISVPTISFPVIPQTLTCTTPLTTIIGSTLISNPSYLWTTADGTIVSGSTTSSAVVSKAGTYMLSVTNIANGCKANASITVFANQTTPNAQIAPSSIITCTQSSITLVGSSTSSPVSVNWTTSDGFISSGATSFSPIITKGGSYVMNVTNTTTGCIGSASISVSEDKAKPVLSIDKTPATLSCGVAITQLNGTAPGALLLWTGPLGASVTNPTSTTPTIDKPGKYYLTATNANGCIAKDSTTVPGNFLTPQNVTINPPGTLTCANPTLQLTGNSSTANVLYSWTAISGGNILSSPISGIITIDAPGTYKLVVSHPSSLCRDSVTVSVLQDISAPSITFPVIPATITCAQSTSTLSSTITPASSTLLWTGPGTISNATISNPVVNVAGVYTLTATNPTTGCKTARTLAVPEDKVLPGISITAPAIITCTQSTVTINSTTTIANYTALWTTSNGSISGATNLLDVVVSKAGLYTLTITNNISGCSVSKNVLVTADNTPPDIMVDKNPAKLTCIVNQVELFGTSLTPSAIYAWTGPGNIIGNNTQKPKVDAVGNFILTITSANGCTSKDTILVTENKTAPAIPNILVPGLLTCTNKTVNLEISPVATNADYIWSTTGSGIILNGGSAIANVDAIGTYKVIVTNRTSGCSNQNTVVVAENKAVPTATILGGPYAVSCANGLIVLDGSTSVGINPIWTASQGGHIVSGANTYNATIDAAGMYTLTVTESVSGCTNSANMPVTTSLDKPTLTIDAYPPSLTCSVASVTLFGKPTQSGTSFSWTANPGNIVSGINTFNPVVDQPGTYILTVTDTVTGCTNTAAIEVKQNSAAPLLVINTPDKFTCTISEVQLAASSTETNVLYTWSTSGTGSIKAGYNNVASPIVLTPGTYTVTATNFVNQCSTINSVAVTEDKVLPNINVDKNTSLLTCSIKKVILSGSSLTPGATYKWSTIGTGNIFNPLSSNPSVDAVGYYTLAVLNPANGCIAKDSAQVFNDIAVPNISVDPTPDILNCLVKNVTVHGNSSTPGGVTYLWDGPGNISDRTIKEPSVDAPGTYFLTVTSSSNGCTASLPVEVMQDTVAPSAPISSNTFSCYNSPATVLSAIGNNIKWYEASILVHSGNTYTPTSATAVNNYTYYITQTDPNNHCEGPAAQVIYSVLALPSAPVNIDNAVCQGLANPPLQASGTNIKWYDIPGGTLLASSNQYTPPASISAPGTYTYFATQTDANGCQSPAKGVSLEIRANPTKPVVDKLTASVCEGVSSNPSYLAAGSNIKWYASPTLPAPIKTGGSFTSLETTAGTYSYYVTQTTTYGCVSPYETVSFTVKPLPQKYTVTGGGVYCENLTGLSVGLNGSQASSAYQLMLNGTTIVSSLNGTGSALNFGNQKTVGSYTIIGTGSNGCQTPMIGGVSVVSTPLPGSSGSITGQIAVCQNTNAIVYSVDSIANATTYLWDIPSGAIITAGLNSKKITVNYSSSAVSGPVRVYGTNACGVGTVSPDFQVVVNHLPDASANIKYVPVNNAICLGDSDVIYEIDPIAYATDYEWILPTGAVIVAGANTNQVKVKFALNAATGNQIVQVRGINNCGNGIWSPPYAITVNPNPSSYAGLDQNICSTTTTLQGSFIPVGGSGVWNRISGSVLIANSSIANSSITSVAQGDNILTWTITNGGCRAIDTIKISNNQLYVDAGANIEICGNDITMNGSALPSSSSGVWNIVTGTAFFTNGSQPNTKASKFGYGDNKLYWIVSKKGCNSIDSVLITNYQPTTPDAGGDQAICYNRTVLSANQPVYGIGQWSLYSGAATFADINIRNTPITNVAIGKNILVWTITNQSCRASDTIIITNNETIVNAGHDMTLCDNRTTLNALPAPPGGIGQWSVLHGSASFLDGSLYNSKVSGFVNGSNILMWSIMKGSCINTDTIEYICNMPTTADAGPDQFIAGNTTLLAANQPVIGTGKWIVMSGSAQFIDDTIWNTTVTNLNPGANILRWSIINKGCTLSDDVVITNGTIEKVDAGQNQIVCASESKMEALKPQYGFGTWTVQKGSAIFEDNETYNTNVTNLAPGDNILRWSVIVSGYEYYDTVIITNNKPTSAITGPRQVLCGDSSGLIGNMPLQGTGRWTLEGGSAVINDFTQYNSKVTGLGTGDNTFRWTITKGACTSSKTLIITNDRPTDAYAGTDQTICDDKSDLFPNTPFIGAGEWSVISGSGKFILNQVTGLAPGINTLKWTIRNNNCTSSDNVVIISHKPTPANAGNNTIVCIDSLFLSANKANVGKGETASWSVMNGAGILTDSSVNTTLVKRIAQGINVLRWTIDNHGCYSYDDVEINYAYVNSIAGDDISLCASQVVLNANNPTIGIGEWSVIGGSGTAIFENSNSPNTLVRNLDQGKNILRWTIRNFSCISTSELTVTNNSPSIAYAGADQNLCTNTVSLAARLPLIGTGVWTVLSGSGSFGDTALYNTPVYNIGIGSNTYRWTLKNLDCVSTDEVVITNNRPLNTFAGVDQTLCSDSAQLSANSPVVGSGIWSIVEGSGTFRDAYNPVTSILAMAPDTNILRWTVTNKQCVEFREIKIINNYPTVAIAGADKYICSEYVILDGNVPVTGIGTWSIISGSASFTSKNLYNSSAQNLMRGKNVLRWSITKANCFSYDDVLITNELPSEPDAGTTISGCSHVATLNANKPAIGFGYWKIISGSGVILDSTQYNTQVYNLGQGSNYFLWTTVNITSKNICTLSEAVEVKNNQTNVYAGLDRKVYDPNIVLTGNQPVRGSGTWILQGGSGNIENPYNFETNVTGLAEGLNTFAWTVDIEGCLSTASVSITYYPLPTAAFTLSRASGCPPLSVSFTKTTVENGTFWWDFGENDSTSTAEIGEYQYKNSGKYFAKLTVIGSDGNPVTTIKTIEVFDVPKIKFDYVPHDIYLPDGEMRCYNETLGGNDYLWEFGDGNTSTDYSPIYVYSDSGIYTLKLTVRTSNQCVDSLIYVNGVHVIETSQIKFPSAFTPNMQGSSGGVYNRNDYSNDVFYPIVIMGGIENYRLQVFNRWGVLVFESTDINIGWDGYYKGKLLMEDVYIYRATGIYNSGKRFNITSDVLLMRK